MSEIGIPAASGAAAVVTATLPPQPISRDVLLEKYAKGDEKTVADVRRRVARALAAVEADPVRGKWERRFLHALEAGFIPAGRINSAAGIDSQATLINCFCPVESPLPRSRMGCAKPSGRLRMKSSSCALSPKP